MGTLPELRILGDLFRVGVSIAEQSARSLYLFCLLLGTRILREQGLLEVMVMYLIWLLVFHKCDRFAFLCIVRVV
jgi:hypothetical protein